MAMGEGVKFALNGPFFWMQRTSLLLASCEKLMALL